MKKECLINDDIKEELIETKSNKVLETVLQIDDLDKEFFILDYEQLCKKPELTIKRLAIFLGVDNKEDLWKSIYDNRLRWKDCFDKKWFNERRRELGI